VSIDGHTHEIREAKSLEEIALTTLAGWLDSDGHRRNLLSSAYVATGIGIAVAENGRIYLTQLFC